MPAADRVSDRDLGVLIGADMDAARAAVLKACHANGILAGIFAYGLDLAKKYRDEGFQIIAVGNEIAMLKDAALDAIAAVR